MQRRGGGQVKPYPLIVPHPRPLAQARRWVQFKGRTRGKVLKGLAKGLIWSVIKDIITRYATKCMGTPGT